MSIMILVWSPYLYPNPLHDSLLFLIYKSFPTWNNFMIHFPWTRITQNRQFGLHQTSLSVFQTTCSIKELTAVWINYTYLTNNYVSRNHFNYLSSLSKIWHGSFIIVLASFSPVEDRSTSKSWNWTWSSSYYCCIALFFAKVFL